MVRVVQRRERVGQGRDGLLQRGGQAWTDAEKMKIADLNWRIVAEKR